MKRSFRSHRFSAPRVELGGGTEQTIAFLAAGGSATGAVRIIAHHGAASRIIRGGWRIRLFLSDSLAAIGVMAMTADGMTLG